jgi:hypothetical protein
MLLQMRTVSAAFVLLIISAPIGTGCGTESPTAVLPAAPTAVPPPVQVAASASLTGKVYDTANRIIGGAVVEVLDGPHAGLRATADANGQYWLTGVFEEGQRLRAARPGYLDGIARVGRVCERCNPHLWVFFQLGLPDAPTNIAGAYTMTIDAPAGCTALPAEARTRTYMATIAAEAIQPTAANTSFRATVGEAPMVRGAWDGVWLAVAGDYVEIMMGDLHGQPGVIEALGNDAYYSADAWVKTTIATGGIITADFEGEIVHCVMKPDIPVLDDQRRHNCAADRAATRVSCRGGRLTLTRR